MVDKILDSLRLAIVIGLFALAVYGGWALYQRLVYDGTKIESRSYVASVNQSDALITGYAYVSVLRFVGPRGSPIVEDWYFGRDVLPKERVAKRDGLKAKDVAGYCHRLYRVAFGFERTSAAITDYSGSAVDRPDLLAVEAIEGYAAGDVTNYACDQLDIVPADPREDLRREAIRRRLVLDRQLGTQYLQACNVLAAIARPPKDDAGVASAPPGSARRVAAEQEWRDSRFGSCLSRMKGQVQEETALVTEYILAQVAEPTKKDLDQKLSLMRLASPMSLDLPEDSLIQASPAIGALKVTLSTVGTVSYEGGFFFDIFFRSEEFYVRRDITVATYGSFLKKFEDHSRWNNKKLRIIVAEEPTLLARDRRIDFAIASDGFKENKAIKSRKDGKNALEQSVIQSVDLALKDIDKAAHALARTYVRASLAAAADRDGVDLSLRFD